MKKLILLAVMLSLPIMAVPILTSITTCTDRSIQVSCDSFANLHIDGGAGGGGFSIDQGMGAMATASLWTGDNLDDYASVTSEVYTSVDFWAATAGDPRPGLATYYIETGGDHGGGSAGWDGGASIGGLAACEGECVASAWEPVPAELGVEFEIQAWARAVMYGFGGGAGGGAILNLRLFDLDGTPVEIFDPPPPGTAVPEPGTAGLVALAGLSGLLYRRRIR